MQGTDNFTVSNGEGVVIEVGKRDPGMIRDADMLYVTTLIYSLVGMQGDAEMGVSVFDTCEITCLLDLDVDG